MHDLYITEIYRLRAISFVADSVGLPSFTSVHGEPLKNVM